MFANLNKLLQFTFTCIANADTIAIIHLICLGGNYWWYYKAEAPPSTEITAP